MEERRGSPWGPDRDRSRPRYPLVGHLSISFPLQNRGTNALKGPASRSHPRALSSLDQHLGKLV